MCLHGYRYTCIWSCQFKELNLSGLGWDISYFCQTHRQGDSVQSENQNILQGAGRMKQAYVDVVYTVGGTRQKHFVMWKLCTDSDFFL